MKLNYEQRQRANQLIEKMAEDSDFQEEVAFELIGLRDMVAWLKEADWIDKNFVNELRERGYEDAD